MSLFDSTIALEPAVRDAFGVALGGAFLLTMLILLAFKSSKIDHGFLGLMFLLTLVVFLIAFSLLIAASVPGLAIKFTVAVVDTATVIASGLLKPRFLEYLES
jgi:hypothetical protein